LRAARRDDAEGVGLLRNHLTCAPLAGIFAVARKRGSPTDTVPGEDSVTPEFECNECGICCSQIPLIVAGDVYEIIRHTKRPPEDFVQFCSPEDFDEESAPEEQWLDMEGGLRIMALRLRGGTCVFRSNGRCSIYAHRPLMCAMHPYNPRDECKAKPEFNLQCHHGCRGITPGPMSAANLRSLRSLYDAFSRREWHYDDLVKRWNRKGRKKRSEEDFLRFIGAKD
jgi:Fe-S-cluster containining protein